MKTNFSRLLLAFVSSISMATTLGLLAQPGLSAEPGDKCTYTRTGEQVIYIREDEDGIFVEGENGARGYVLSSELTNCTPPDEEG